MTLEEIDAVIEQLYQDGNQSVSLGDDRSYTRFDLSKLLELRDVLRKKALKEVSDPSSKTFLKVTFLR